VRILRSEEVLKVLAENGLDVIANTPAEFAAMIRQETRIWDESAAIAGLITQ
jgi:tripartite-type tricarboxylate transporter receptor subunit TctC